MAAANLIFSIASVKVGTKETETYGTDLGVTKGGGTLTQDITSVEIRSDQKSDPEAIIATQAPKTLTLNLLDASPENLALAFGGTATGSVVTIPALVEGIEKGIKITTRTVNKVYYEIEIPRALIKGNSTITFGSDDASTIPLDVAVLKPASDTYKPVTIKKITTT
ncbi:MAG: hypothetical protein WBI45_06335 [Defluviitoga tunisiensis]